MAILIAISKNSEARMMKFCIQVYLKCCSISLLPKCKCQVIFICILKITKTGMMTFCIQAHLLQIKRFIKQNYQSFAVRSSSKNTSFCSSSQLSQKLKRYYDVILFRILSNPSLAITSCSSVVRALGASLEVTRVKPIELQPTITIQT